MKLGHAFKLDSAEGSRDLRELVGCLGHRWKLRLRRLLPPNQQEKRRAEALRSEIRVLPATTPDQAVETAWQGGLADLRKNILRKDVRFFLSWPAVEHTMFHTARKPELEALRKSPLWESWLPALTELPVGHPPPYPSLPRSSGNLIHHAYSLLQISNAFPSDVSKMSVVFEFGGGYGSLVRLLYQLGFTGLAVVRDLPILSALQEYYLDSLGLKIGISRKPCEYRGRAVALLSGSEQVTEQLALTPQLDLFIALWSLSETPVGMREIVERTMRASRHVLIAYQDSFEGIDNQAYFTDLARRNPQFEWKTVSIAHLPKNTYLIGEKKP